MTSTTRATTAAVEPDIGDERSSPLALPPSRYPTGWFQIGWARDLEPGDVKNAHYFGRELALFRTESGKLVVLDAHCRHLGANIGIGGRVCGEQIECPWHGWKYNDQGENTEIPYSKHGPRNVALRSWPVREYYGTIQIWHDLAGRAPFWELPAIPELDTSEFYPLVSDESIMVNRVRMHCQNPTENMADAAHIYWIHGSSEIPTMSSFYSTDYLFHTEVSMVYGGGKASTWLTPNGPIDALIVMEAFGIGVTTSRFEGLYPTVQLAGFTPVDEEYTDYFFQQASLRDEGDTGDAPQGNAEKMMRLQKSVIPQDFFIWENMQHLGQPTFAKEEAACYAGFRRWANQQYPAQVTPPAGE
jgi:phenylpropionate dioxygenase-like ring-hydroxylating dioxygenase large terminal subunit